MKAEDILSEVLRRYEEALKKRGVSAKTLAEAQDLSGKLGKDLGRILAEELLKAFPAGAVPEDVAMGVIPAALRRNSDIVSGFVREIQKRLNEAARVPAPPELRFRHERAANLARWVSKQESFADHETIFSQYVEQNSRMTVDDAVRDQVKAHYGMGLSPKIIRKAAPGCCDWCTKHAGTVDYSKGMHKEIFRRHKNCPCLIEYDPDKGARNIERVNNYRFDNQISDEENERRINMLTQPSDELSSSLINRRKQIARGIMIDPRFRDVTDEYKRLSTPGVGNIAFEPKWKDRAKGHELRIANELKQIFGGDILMVNNAGRVTKPDIEWFGKKWEIKSCSDEDSIDKQTQKAIHQTDKYGGSIIIDFYDENDFDGERIVRNRMLRSAGDGRDVVLFSHGKFLKVLRYK